MTSTGLKRSLRHNLRLMPLRAGNMATVVLVVLFVCLVGYEKTTGRSFSDPAPPWTFVLIAAVVVGCCIALVVAPAASFGESEVRLRGLLGSQVIDIRDIESVQVRYVYNRPEYPVIKLRVAGDRRLITAWGIDPYSPEAHEFFAPFHVGDPEV